MLLKNFRRCYIINEISIGFGRGDFFGLRFEVRRKLDFAAGAVRHPDARARRQTLPRRQETFNRSLRVHDNFLPAVYKFRRRKINGLARRSLLTARAD